MPVTARLSRGFYDRFGDDIANELVEWFNSVDATYRADLREINELNFARFDATMTARFAQIDVRFKEVDARFDQVDARFEQVDARFAQVDARFAAFEQRIEKRLAVFEDRIERRLAEFETRIVERIAASESKMTNWMVMFCGGQVLALAGLVFAILRAR
jgi:uncharacterized protein (DUF3084 family)